MTKAFIWFAALFLAMAFASPASAENFGTFLRVTAHADLSGRTELAIYKAYAGQQGPIRDIISMQDPDPDGYPRVEIATTGAIKATRESGRILIESTGPGPGTVNVYVTFNRLRSSWWIHNPDAPGVGAVKLNAITSFGEGIHAAKQGNHFTVRSPDDSEIELKDHADRKGWSANADIPAGSRLRLDIAGEPDRVAPLWMTQASLGLALASLALSGYLTLRLKASR